MAPAEPSHASRTGVRQALSAMGITLDVVDDAKSTSCIMAVRDRLSDLGCPTTEDEETDIF